MSHAADFINDRWPAGDPRIPPLVADWFGPQDWIWSSPPPPGRRVAFVTSRLPRLVDPHGAFLTGLRSALEHVRTAGRTIVVSHGTANSDLVLRHAIRERTPVMLFHIDRSRGRRAGREMHVADFETLAHGVVSVGRPAAASVAVSRDAFVAPEIEQTPERDRAAIAWADDVFVLQLRTAGNLHRLLRHRLQTPRGNLWLVDLPGLQSRTARAELLGLGAKLWSPSVDVATNNASASPTRSTAPSIDAIQHSTTVTQQSLLPCSDAVGWDFLTHTTRACLGPWPGQSHDDYLDSLLDARSDADHSPLAALAQIVSQRRLVASDRAIRQGHRVVSFTAVPLAEISQLRVFRSHRGRWDFDPYGICIRRRWLEERGAKPVIYTGNSDWKRLPDAEQPFFQYVRHLDSTKTPGDMRTPGIDWSLEREWRHVGDVDLSRLAVGDAMLFAPTTEAARKLLEISPWPVTVLA